MTNNTSAQSLHARETRGEVLTETEQTTLVAECKQQDHTEAAIIGTSEPEITGSLDTLREEIAASITRLREAAQRIQMRTEENEALRREINTLSEKLTQTGSRQAV